MITPLSSCTDIKHTIRLSEADIRKLPNLCGAHHANIAFIEAYYQISIKLSEKHIYLIAKNNQHFSAIENLFKTLISQAELPISIEMIQAHLSRTKQTTMNHKQITLKRKAISARNERQSHYLEGIDNKDMVFAAGPAGTGKTYIAVAKAVEYYEKGEVQRLVFVRPAVEAGEKLGFLPGDLVEKVLPYLRPIYDALYEMVGFKETQKLIQADVIEVLPLAFMRGRTLNDAFVILDEAQNTSVAQMQMFLTRIGFGTKAVITGDMTQIDLPKGVESGLSHAIHLLNDVEEIGIYNFTSKEVVRHPLVSKIIDYYESDKGSR